MLLLDPYHFCPLLCPSLHEIFLSYLQFSWRELSSFPFYCFPLFLCIVHSSGPSYLSLLFSGILHSVGYIFLFFPSLLSSAICKAYSDNHFALLPFFFFRWFWSPLPVQCYKPPSIVLQALCPPDLIPWIYSSPPLSNHKGFDLGHIWMT